MTTIELHERALQAATTVVDGVGAADLGRPTPCAEWDLATLLAHCIGQNHGFAAALERATPAVADFAPRPFAPAAWAASVVRVRAAFRDADPRSVVTLPELGLTVAAATAQRMHLLDTVVHTWDVAAALGRRHRPDDELVAAVSAIAGRVPAGGRTGPGAAFGPVRPGPGASEGADPWAAALARLGRDPSGDEP